MTVEVTVKTVEPTPTAVVAATTTWEQFPTVWGPLLDRVWRFLRSEAPEGLYKQGHNVMLYRDGVRNAEVGAVELDAVLVEVGVQVSGSFAPTAGGDVVASVLPGGLIATATHTGPISQIGGVHQAVRQWAVAHGYTPTGPLWEIYGDPDPATGRFDVDVFCLLDGA